MVSEKLQQAIDRIRRYKSGERAEDVWQKPSGTLGSRADYLEDACFVADYVVFPNLMELMEASDEATESRMQALQQLADQAQELKMGYEAAADEAESK